jgi:2-hydroxychromene-2-carboxylate isomerase
MQQIEFYYDFGSPNAYLVDAVIHRIASRHDARVVLKPILLGGVFKATNNQPPMAAFAAVPPKLDYLRTEIARFVKRYEVAFFFNPHFPVMTVAVMRGAVASLGQPYERDYYDTVMRAMWHDGEKMDDPDVIAQVLTAAGLPAAEIMEAAQTQKVKDRLRDLTDAAVARGVFGAPTMFVGEEMFFGKDSLDDLDWYLGTRD